MGQQVKLHSACVAQLEEADNATILKLHELGRRFQNAAGAYMDDNVSKFPKGTLSAIMGDDDRKVMAGLLNGRSHVDQNTMSLASMEAHGLYYGVHIYCLFMQCQEKYMSELKVTFKDIADSVNYDASDKEAVKRDLEVCEKYDFAPMKRLLELKLAA